jgi:hypothetical protein
VPARLVGMSRFWLCYRESGHFTGAIVVEAGSPVEARVKAAIAGLDHGLVTCDALELGEATLTQLPRRLIGRVLDPAKLRKLERHMEAAGNPAVGSVRRVRRRAA